MFKKILVILIAVLILVAVVGWMLPRNSHVERSVLIDRPVSLVYATVNSFQQFAKWSPWQDLDPTMHQTTEGPREGVGAKLVWSGNDKVGSGTQIITASDPDRLVASDVDFGKMGVAKSSVVLASEGPQTRVRWTLDIDMGANPIAHYFGLTMDRMIGKDYENGLNKLKALAESMPNADLSAFSAELVELNAAPVVVVAETTPADIAAISKGYAEGYGRIAKFMLKNKLRQSGAPLGIDGAMTAATFTFEAGIPVDRSDVSDADGIRVIHCYQGKALKTTHVGSYDTLPATYVKLAAYLAAHGYKKNGAVISWYVDDPASTPAEKMRTEMYAPIE